MNVACSADMLVCPVFCARDMRSPYFSGGVCWRRSEELPSPLVLRGEVADRHGQSSYELTKQRIEPESIPNLLGIWGKPQERAGMVDMEGRTYL